MEKILKTEINMIIMKVWYHTFKISVRIKYKHMYVLMHIQDRLDQSVYIIFTKLYCKK